MSQVGSMEDLHNDGGGGGGLWSYVQESGSQITLQREAEEGAGGRDGRLQGGQDDDKVSADSTTCGWWLVRPQWLQSFSTSKWVLFWLCWAAAIQGMVVNGFVNVVITTIERRYNLRSTDTGLVAGAYDVASFLCLVPVSYFGGRSSGNKPRWLGWGMIFMGMGSVLFSLPHFTSGLYTFDSQEDGVCSTTNSSRSDHTFDCSLSSSLSNNKYVFILAQLLHGIGAAPLYTLGVTYIDENVSTKMSSVYIGIYYSMAIVGPAIGYLVGGQFLKIYVDVDTKKISPSSGVWVGAWWIGFLLSGFLSFIVAVPIMAFPKELPGSREIRMQKISEAHRSSSEDDVVNKVGFGTSTKDLPKSLKILVSNPTFMFLNFAGAFEALLLSGFAAFLPKYIESQFNVAASWSAILVGCVTVTSGGGGTFLGGYLIKRFQLRCAGIIKMCVTCAFISLCFCVLFIFHCPNVPFAGVNASYRSSSSSIETMTFPDLIGVCASNCHCSVDPPVFTDCSCVVLSKDSSNATLDEDDATAKRELCRGTCNILPVVLVLAFVFSLCTFLASMPALSATLRCVADQQRSFALGIQWMIVRLLGSIPAPILFGFLMDLTCTLWQIDSCGNEGSCRFYNNEDMSRNMLTVSVVGKVLSTSCFFLAVFLYKGPSTKEDDPQASYASAPPTDRTGTNVPTDQMSVDPPSPATGGLQSRVTATVVDDGQQGGPRQWPATPDLPFLPTAL